MSRTWLVSTLLAAALLTGCGGWKMMPAPIAYQRDGVDPFAQMAPDDRDTTIEVLYATDRSRTRYRTPSKWYGESRGLALRLGMATVRLGGEGASWDTVSRRSRSSDRPAMKLVELEEFGKLWTTIPISDPDFAAASEEEEIREATRRFVDEVNAQLAASEWKEVVIYVPGFNTPFEAPVQMMAQYKHFMGRDGAFIAYSWPARSTPLGYSKQMVSAGVSTRNLRQLILLLAEETNAEQINLVCYSAGAPVLTDALLQLRLMHVDETGTEMRSALRIGTVLYAGADQDLDYFRNLYLDGFDTAAENITIYTSRDDAGLGLSRLFTTGSPRLGNVMRDLTDADLQALREGTTTSFVDVTDASRAAGGGDIFSHGYWYLNAWVNQDVINLLRTNASPGDRGLVRDEGEALWAFPSDYPTRARGIASEAVR